MLEYWNKRHPLTQSNSNPQSLHSFVFGLAQPFSEFTFHGNSAHGFHLAVDDESRGAHDPVFAYFLDISYMVDPCGEIQFADCFHDLPFESVTIRAPRSEDLYFQLFGWFLFIGFSRELFELTQESHAV